jgi:DNA (cytosine-5)-methyltransferase 1
MLTAKDLFCGAGGSSSGMELVAGVVVKFAMNHWQLAIDTHARNLPHADHDCADVSQVDPRRYPRTDLLWASPECTWHSPARGRRRMLDAQPDLFGEVLPPEAAQRSRATMWDVVRFAEHFQYRAVLVENVVDAYWWPPFRAWLLAMGSLGYTHRIVWLNSMHAQAFGPPAPQSRDRLYVVFWRRGERAPDLDGVVRPAAFCPVCRDLVRARQVFKRPDRPSWGRYRQQYLYRCPNAACRHQVVEPAWLPAATAIDWRQRGERIGARSRPLAANTLARVRAGLARYARPIALGTAGDTFKCRPQVATWQVDAPLDIAAAGRNHPGLLSGFVMRNNGSRGDGGEHCTPLWEVLRTITTAGHQSLVSFPVDAAAAGRAGGISVEDCFFRMLTPDEVKLAMAFTAAYTLLGTNREQVRLAGNAVTPPAARDLVAAVAEALTGQPVTAAAAKDHPRRATVVGFTDA